MRPPRSIDVSAEFGGQGEPHRTRQPAFGRRDNHGLAPLATVGGDERSWTTCVMGSPFAYRSDRPTSLGRRRNRIARSTLDATTDNETAHCRRYAETCRSAALRQFGADISAACDGCALSAWQTAIPKPQCWRRIHSRADAATRRPAGRLRPQPTAAAGGPPHLNSPATPRRAPQCGRGCP